MSPRWSGTRMEQNRTEPCGEAATRGEIREGGHLQNRGCKPIRPIDMTKFVYKVRRQRVRGCSMMQSSPSNVITSLQYLTFD
jgi:hypothetical protein